MRGTLSTWGDRLLSRIVPSTRASACTYPTYCAFRYKACAGPQCYYYYQDYKTCRWFTGTVDSYCAGAHQLGSHPGCC